MFKIWILMCLFVLGAFVPGNTLAPLQKKSVKKGAIAAHPKKGPHHKGVLKNKAHQKGKVRRKPKHHSKYAGIKKVDTVRKNTLQIISLNKEKARLNDSVHHAIVQDQIVNVNGSKTEEGYFASLFSDQKKTASFQTLDGTASVFKSISGWQDKKFYILTNEIPIGTIVRITTSDLKTICAKVINALPEVSNSIQYRLSDAAVAILGITNKTFQIKVTY